MKIALLTLQYDNNYGGNLQRFALSTVLQRMGHDVTCLYLDFIFFPKSRIQYLKNIVYRIIYRIITRKPIEIFVEKHNYQKYLNSCKITRPFFDHYVKHTDVITSKKQLRQYVNFDAFIVGSDQVWRKKFTEMYGIDTFFFDYLPNDKTNRIAYGVSFGSDENELSPEDIKHLTPLFNKFKKISVREESALNMLQNYKWGSKDAEVVLDPTLLLSSEDYDKIINENETSNIQGNVFCYILDSDNQKEEFIQRYAKEHNKTIYSGSLGTMDVPQWLLSFKECDYVITDSYHGVLFSIIYNKPFHVFFNKFRGSARFASLEKILSFKMNQENYNWLKINEKLTKLRKKSISFLGNALL